MTVYLYLFEYLLSIRRLKDSHCLAIRYGIQAIVSAVRKDIPHPDGGGSLQLLLYGGVTTADFIQFHENHSFPGRIIEMVSSLEVCYFGIMTHSQVFGQNLHPSAGFFRPQKLTHSDRTFLV